MKPKRKVFGSKWLELVLSFLAEFLSFTSIAMIFLFSLALHAWSRLVGKKRR